MLTMDRVEIVDYGASVGMLKKVIWPYFHYIYALLYQFDSSGNHSQEKFFSEIFFCSWFHYKYLKIILQGKNKFHYFWQPLAANRFTG
jgi:hypothetical protein